MRVRRQLGRQTPIYSGMRPWTFLAPGAQVPSHNDCGMFRFRPVAESAAWHRKTA